MHDVVYVWGQWGLRNGSYGEWSGIRVLTVTGIQKGAEWFWTWMAVGDEIACGV